MPRNRELLARARRSAGQDRRLAPRARAGRRTIRQGYEAFLREIGYLVPEPADFTIETTRARSRDRDASAARSWWCRCRNARYALNAANARWGSLYDALYGTDAISRDGDLAPGKGFNAARGAAVVAQGAEFLDEAFPLAQRQPCATSPAITWSRTATAAARGRHRRRARPALRDPAQFVGYRRRREAARRSAAAPSTACMSILVIDPAQPDRQRRTRPGSPTSSSRAR